MPKRTYQPKKRKRMKTHGFRSRSASVLKNRRSKKRWKLTVSDEIRDTKNKRIKRSR